MKTRTSALCITTLLFAALLVLSSSSVAEGRVEPLGWWIYVEHEEWIPPYTMLWHTHYAPYAYHGYASLEYSSGPVGFAYYWAYPYLDVFIDNGNPYWVYVVWRCWFYVW